jgi:hypothetical protein
MAVAAGRVPCVARNTLASAAAVIACLAAAACGSAAPVRWPSRATPLNSTFGWFEAINAHARQRLLSYVAPSARYMMAWARPSAQWSKFTDLHCHAAKSPGHDQARVDCIFNESASPTEGNPDTAWGVSLRYTVQGWLIDNYGQG